MKKKILITGGSGLLAVNWAIQTRDVFEIILCQHTRVVAVKGVKNILLDLSEITSITDAILLLKPDLVVHTAGLTNVDECEKNRELSEETNITLSLNVAIACKKTETKLVHISTDHLYDGKKQYLKEDEEVSPVNIYGETKAASEEKVLENNPAALIIRTNFYGYGTSYRKSFSDFIINNLKSNQSVDLFDDVFYTPIIIESLVSIVHLLVDKNEKGVFNIVGDDRISKYQFGIKVAQEFDLNSSLIKKVKFFDQKLVKRPRDMSLSNKKVSNHLNIKVGGSESHLFLLKKQYINGIAEELMKI